MIKTKASFLLVFFFLLNYYSVSETIIDEKKQQAIDQPIFLQKGGLMQPNQHAIYTRTNDEWTGFSTFYFGYRYGVSDAFNIAVEIGASGIPHVYLGGIHFYFRMFESGNKFFFLGLRSRLGYRYQDTDLTGELWQPIVGKDYLNLQRNGIYFAADLTVALRLGAWKEHNLYYTIYPRLDFDFVDQEDPVHFLFSPGMLGWEFRFGKYLKWSFAVEAGYTFPIPWNSLPQGKWVNFPSLANLGLYYRFN